MNVTTKDKSTEAGFMFLHTPPPPNEEPRKLVRNPRNAEVEALSLADHGEDAAIWFNLLSVYTNALQLSQSYQPRDM